MPRAASLVKFCKRSAARSSTSFHRALFHKQPHPEEHREAMRLEGWATTTVYPTLRDGPAGLLRVRLGLHPASARARKVRQLAVSLAAALLCCGGATGPAAAADWSTVTTPAPGPT